MAGEVSVLVLCQDLLFSSQVHGAIQRSGRTGRTCLSPEGCLTQLAKTPVDFVIVDLQTPQLSIASLKAAAGPDCRIIGYGPHVRTELFEAAQQAGCDLLLTRGQAVREIERQLSEPGSPDDRSR